MKRVTPIINELLAGWKLIPASELENEACNVLGKYCGIDYLLTNDEQVYGLSSKVLYGKNYRTFTVSKNEYAKRSAAFESSSLRPYYTMQGYFDGNKIIGLGLIKTVDLLSFIKKGLAEERGKSYVCNWDVMKSAGYDVREYSAQVKGHDTADIGSFVRLEPLGSKQRDEEKQETVAKKWHEAWHEAYQQYLEEQHDEENCAECDAREVCEGLSAILNFSTQGGEVPK